MDNCILIQQQKVAWNKYQASKQSMKNYGMYFVTQSGKIVNTQKWRTQFKLVEAPTTYLSFGNQSFHKNISSSM
jgi:hypothetical protein